MKSWLGRGPLFVPPLPARSRTPFAAAAAAPAAPAGSQDRKQLERSDAVRAMNAVAVVSPDARWREINSFVRALTPPTNSS